MEPDDLRCSRNARPRKALVGRAQWKINQPPSLRENERAWRDHLYSSTRAIEDRPGWSVGTSEFNITLEYGLIIKKTAPRASRQLQEGPPSPVLLRAVVILDFPVLIAHSPGSPKTKTTSHKV